MATGKKTGGRRRGTPNKITAEMRAQALETGKTMLQIMTENARWMDDQVQLLLERLEKTSGEEFSDLLTKIVQLRAISHQMAARAAPFFHPQLADVRHDHRTEDGKTIRPIIEITGYPTALKEIAPPTPALPVALLSTKQ
jgi:hypothetical protein